MRERADVVTDPSPGAEGEEELLPHPVQLDAAVTAFGLLADPTRLRLLWLLSRTEYDVGTLAQLAQTTPAAASQHLGKLRLAGLVRLRRDGRRHIYGVRDTHVRQLIREALHHADHLTAGRPDHP